MTAIVNKILAADSYIDDIVVNEEKVAADQVVKHLRCYGLKAKPSENVNGGRVLGLRVVTWELYTHMKTTFSNLKSARQS